MENKKAMQIIVERIASDNALKEKVLTGDVKEFLEQLKENGLTDITEERAEEMLNRVKAVFTADGEELDMDVLEKASGGFTGACKGGMACGTCFTTSC